MSSKRCTFPFTPSQARGERKLQRLHTFLYRILCIAGFYAYSFSAADAVENMHPSTNSIAAANNDFGFRLYEGLDKNTNAFVSPYSLYSALSLLAAGTRSDTLEQMQRFLKIKNGHNLEDIAKLNKELTRTDAYILTIANALFVQNDFKLNDGFLNKAAIVHSEIKKENFLDTNASAQSINEWVAHNTNNKIRNIVTPSTIASTMKLALGNAVYFYGKWATPFQPRNTFNSVFTSDGGAQKKVQTMWQQSYFKYYENADLQMLELPYQGDKLAMVIMLPKKNLTDLESKMNAASFADEIAKFSDEEVNVKLPKFTLNSSFEFSQWLTKAGLDKPFGNDADLSAIAGTSCTTDLNHCLKVNAILHKAYIDVNEQGTEAAATTIVNMAIGAAYVPPEKPPKQFIADHSFMFAIYDKQTTLLLFLGRITDPGSPN